MGTDKYYSLPDAVREVESGARLNMEADPRQSMRRSSLINLITPLAVLIFLLSFSGSLQGRGKGEIVKDRLHGFAFRAPRKWVSIPVDPLDTLTLHKYQAEKADRGDKLGMGSLTANLN